MNNKNHKLQICEDGEGNDKYVCAVYTGEIICVLLQNLWVGFIKVIWTVL